jgi:hypothetical protein
MNAYINYFWAFALLLSCHVTAVYAQPSQNKADEEAIKKQLYAFAKAYSDIPATKRKESVLDFMSPDLISTNIVSRIDGKVSGDYGDYKSFEGYLDKLTKEENLKIVYKVTGIDKVYVRGTTGVIVYSIDYEFAKEGSTWWRGNETVMMLMRKVGTEWKINHFTFINVEDEKFKGTCICETFVAETGDYVAKTTVPSGKSYSTSLKIFDFKGADNIDRTINIDEYSFIWKAANGEILANNEKASKKTPLANSIGMAKNKEEAVVLILEKIIFGENCAEVKVKGKKK